MANLKLFKSTFVNSIKSKLRRGEVYKEYLGSGIRYSDNDVFENPNLVEPNPKNLGLAIPDSGGNYDFENSKMLFNHFKRMNPTEASDARIWTYLAHITFWDYMKERWPIKNRPEEKQVSHILGYWFLDPVGPRSLIRHGISHLWWVAYLTYDESRKDPYELTREIFSMRDYTRHLLEGTQGREKDFLHAVLEFVIENKSLFSEYKESKVRFIMRKCNYVAGYKLFPGLDKEEIKGLLQNYQGEIKGIRS
jgi:hypothetical protein